MDYLLRLIYAEILRYFAAARDLQECQLISRLFTTAVQDIPRSPEAGVRVVG